MKSMKSKKVVVIGGSSGIGLATAKGAVALGAEVIIASRTPEKLERAKQEIGEERFFEHEVLRGHQLFGTHVQEFARVGDTRGRKQLIGNRLCIRRLSRRSSRTRCWPTGSG